MELAGCLVRSIWLMHTVTVMHLVLVISWILPQGD